MKKCIALLLCLMMLLPLYVYADSTEGQPAAQGESQPPETQPQASQPPETQPPASQPPETQPPASQPPETQPAETKPVETQPSNHTHVWDVTYTIPATCKEEGATGRGCSACGAIEVEVLPKLTEHVYGSACDADCNVCGATREAEHKFSSQWTKNASGHWHACISCGEQSDFGKHYPGPAATEEKAQICLTCGYTLTAKKGHTHKYDTQWTSDETGHWYACSGCDEQKDFADHSFDNGCDPDCNICGYQSSSAHIYTGTWSSDETGHWDVCTICQEKSPVEPHIPGPEATETDAQFCAACNFQLAAAQPSVTDTTEHAHLGEGTWLTDEESHWKTCACGEETEKLPHIWDAGEQQEDSTILYTCEDCGFTRTEGEPETGGINPLVWIGIAIAALLAAAGAVAWLLIAKIKKGGKYHK